MRDWANGAVWRIATCHFTHFTYEQLAWDAFVFLFLALACDRINRGAFRATLLASVPIAVLAVSNVTEMASGATIFVHSGAFTAVPVAHIAGALLGVIAGAYSSSIEHVSRGWPGSLRSIFSHGMR
jgi:hypothetical protein